MVKYYAVAIGKETGLFTSWSQVEPLVKGFPGAKHKSFSSMALAQEYLDQHVTSSYVDPKDNNESDLISPGHSYSPTLGGRYKKTIERSFSNDSPIGTERNLIDLEFVENSQDSGEDCYDAIIYTDGSAKNEKAGYGIVKITKTKSLVTMKGVLPPDLYPKATNNQSELYGIYQALIDTTDLDKVLIKSDSKYSIDCLTKWYRGWIRNGWKTSNGSDVLNKNLIQSILEEIRRNNRIVDFKHVFGHTGNPYNELADRLANEARVSLS